MNQRPSISEAQGYDRSGNEWAVERSTRQQWNAPNSQRRAPTSALGLVATRMQNPPRGQGHRAYHLMVRLARHQLRRWATGLTIISLPLIGVVLAPTSFAQDDFDCIGSISLDRMMNSGSTFPPSDPQSGWTQPGDLVIPASGGPPQVAVAPAPPGAPVVTGAGGAPVVPGAPPIG